MIDDFVGPATICVLSEAMVELKSFFELAHRASWKSDKNKALARTRGLIRRPMVCIFENVKKCNENMKCGIVIPKSPPLQWTELSPLDWHSICISFLLLSYGKAFCSTFGREKILLEILKGNLILSSVFCKNCGRWTMRDRDVNHHSSSYPYHSSYSSGYQNTPNNCSACQIPYVDPCSDFLSL